MRAAAMLEVETYRRLGHAEHDGQEYVPAEELERWATRDPITRFHERALGEGWLTQEELDRIRERVAAEVDEARAAAESSPLPEPETALYPVYGDADVLPPWTRHSVPNPALA